MVTEIHKSYKYLNKLLENKKQILLSTHVNPDGDGLGSELAFYNYLIDKGKECKIINVSKTPEIYKFLESIGHIDVYDESFNDWILSCDLVIAFDIGDFERLKEIGSLTKKNVPVLCFDHHPHTDDGDFTYLIIDEKAPATGFMVWEYLQQNYKNKVLPISIAIPLYVSLVTDTGSFRYESTTADTHRMATHLIESGVDIFDIQKNIFEQRTLPQVKILGKVIENSQFAYKNKIAWAEITIKQLKECGAKYEDLEGLGDFLRAIRGVEVSVIMIERENNKTKLTFRSKGRITVNDVAHEFDGGGHKFAAGAVTDYGDSDAIMKKIKNILVNKLKDLDVN